METERQGRLRFWNPRMAKTCYRRVVTYQHVVHIFMQNQRGFVGGMRATMGILLIVYMAIILCPLISEAYSNCPTISRALARGSSGTEVSQLQQFLSQDATVYPEGLVTGYFGALTERAVQRWQAQLGLVSSGSPSTTGYGTIGPRTRAAMRSTCSDTNRPVGTTRMNGTYTFSPKTSSGIFRGGDSVNPGATISAFAGDYVGVRIFDFQNIQEAKSMLGLSSGDAYGDSCDVVLNASIAVESRISGTNSRGTPTVKIVQVFSSSPPKSSCTSVPLQTSPIIKVTSPTLGQVVKLDNAISVSWWSENAPPNSIVDLQLVNVKTGEDVGHSTNTSNTTHSFAWTPISHHQARVSTSSNSKYSPPSSGAACDGTNVFSCMIISEGTYKIVAKLYGRDSSFEIQKLKLQNPLATSESGVFTISQ